MTITKALLGAALLASAGAASAVTTVTHRTNTVPVTGTSWNNFLNIPMFDPALGTLLSASLTLTGLLEGNIRVESLDFAPALVTATLGAEVRLRRPDPDGGTLVVTLPGITRSFTTGPFDGAIDFGGASGASFLNLTASGTNSASWTSGPGLAFFVGTGFLSAPISAVSTSNASGAGNLLASFQTRAGGYADVTYTYQVVTPPPVVPEPATWAMMITGFGMVGWMLRRRQARLHA